MESRLFGPIDRFRRPEYTGENRCIPCTAVNVVIAVALGGAVALFEPLVGVAVFVASLLAIYLRGYLVPGTPTLTKRYFPDWLLAKFDKAPEPGSGVETEATVDGEDASRDDVDPERLLLDAGVVAPCEDVDDLCLADEVRDRLRERTAELLDEDIRAPVADFLEADPETVEVNLPEDPQYATVRTEGRLAARWESEAALVTDLAASTVLDDVIPEWETYSLSTRSQVASGLRAFVEQCPSCGGPISIGGETVESCCRSYEVYAVACDDCETRLLEITQ